MLAAIPIFALMSLDVQIETLLAIEKILRVFLWKGRRDAQWWPLFGGMGPGLYAKGSQRAGDYKLPEDEHCATGALALA
jgi:hypothetical protein